MSLVADGFRCKRCDGTIQEADLSGDLVVDGETYGCVKSFCYLGDTLNGDGGADLAAKAITTTTKLESEMVRLDPSCCWVKVLKSKDADD